MTQPVALITGGARRIGAAIAEKLHRNGFRVIIHYQNSATQAQQLCQTFNLQRSDSAAIISADLNQIEDINQLSHKTIKQFGQLNLLVNNASSFYPTPIATATLDQWDNLFNSNAKAPFFLSQALAGELVKQRGSIINIADIHAEKPLKNHTLYCMAKAANVMLTKSLAKELAPNVRVNGIAPGAILWPESESELDNKAQADILTKIPLARAGDVDNIANTVKFLALDNNYINGQILAVDGGRSIN
jgi:pteridine reductase